VLVVICTQGGLIRDLKRSEVDRPMAISELEKRDRASGGRTMKRVALNCFPLCHFHHSSVIEA